MGPLNQTDRRGRDVSTFVRPVIRERGVYSPATVTPGSYERVVKLDMNESPFGPSPSAKKVLQEFVGINRYPGFNQDELRNALSDYVNVPADQIVCGAGLDDVLNSIALALFEPGDEVVISEPTFGVYRVFPVLYGATVLDAPLNDDFSLDVERILSAVTSRTKLVIICTPNNPTGNLLDPAAIETIVSELDCPVAIDEAYAEFAGTSYVPMIDSFPNAMVLRTLSKFAGLAGMRVGYGMFSPELAPFVASAAPPFQNITVLSRELAIASLADLEHLRQNVATIIAERDRLLTRLSSLPGIEPVPSSTNFILMRLTQKPAEEVHQELARRGIFIRSFGAADPRIRDCLRVSIGAPEENQIFLENLNSIVATEVSA